MFVAPGVVPDKHQNPGYTVFEVDSKTMVAKNMKMVFLDLESSYGMKEKP